MAAQSLNLPINIPWRLIAVSPDMIDTQFCDKQFPLEWRSSVAISVFEPSPEDLPANDCAELISYLKVTCTITGYQPTRPETAKAYESFPDELFDPDKSDAPKEFDRLIRDYWACYGVLVNVAVFPYPGTRKELREERIDIAELTGGPQLPNPLSIQRPSATVSFHAAGAPANFLKDIFPEGGDGKQELHLPFLPNEMVITFEHAGELEISVIEATVVVSGGFPVGMAAFKGTELLGTQSTAHKGQPETLLIEADGIDKVVLTKIFDDDILGPIPQGASLLEFRYVCTTRVPVEAQNYPHIASFEPKTRDLYQAATESGEILTASASSVKTDKSFTNTDSSETGVSLQGSAGHKPPQETGGYFDEATGGITHKWGETSQDSTSIQTDASRERRETQGTTTSVSQMYNLLTGYHAGTNRAVFLMFPRPHILQPTDHRTFIQGLRVIEGVQDFFLVVTRAEGIEGLSIEASLETGHFPEDVSVVEPDVEYDEGHENFIVTARSKQGDPRAIEEFLTSTYTIESGWVIDRRKGDSSHRGIVFLGGKDEQGDIPVDSPEILEQRIKSFNYQPVSDSTIQVSGKVLPQPGSDIKHVELRFRVHTRSERPKPTSTQPRVPIDCLLVTGRQLCVSYRSGPCPQVDGAPTASSSYVLDERCLEVDSSLVMRDETAQTRLTAATFTTAPDGSSFSRAVSPTLLSQEPRTRTRLPAMKELLRRIQSTMTNSGRLPTRLPPAEVGFLDTDYFKNRVKNLMRPQVLGSPLGDLAVPPPPEVIEAFGADATVEQALTPSLTSFAARTGLSIRAAADARFALLTLKIPVP